MLKELRAELNKESEKCLQTIINQGVEFALLSAVAQGLGTESDNRAIVKLILEGMQLGAKLKMIEEQMKDIDRLICGAEEIGEDVTLGLMEKVLLGE